MNVTTPFESAGTIGGNGNFPFHAAARPLSPPLDAGRFLSAEPRVRIREEHNISRRDIDPDALKILYRLARNNYIAYLVGGGVRDLLLGRNPKDFDISTDAKPEQIRALFRNSILIGRRFRLAHIRYGEKVIETSTFRRTPECAADPSNPEADLFQRDDNLFGTPQEDALRRDFTVNGLFYDIETFSVIDYVDGLEDLAARRIRAIGDPCIRFREDPVRMIRAVRFASRLDFDLDADTGEAIRRHRDELAKASSARLLEEITRLFAFSAGEKAVRLLRTTGLLEVVLPEMTKTLENHEARDRLWKYLSALDRGDTVLPDATPALIFAALLLEPLKRHLNRDWLAEDFSKLKYERVHSFLAPISLRLKLPRRLADRIVHIYLAQHRLANPGGKSGAITGFVTQDSFHESLALAEILRAAEGCSQAPLNQWRDMLAERIYGREEETGRGRRRNAGGADNGKEETAAPDGQPGEPGMSRSARRRRNRKLRRMQDREIPAVVKADANGPSAAAGEDTESLTEPAGSETVPALTPVTDSRKEEQPSGNRKRRNRRGKGESGAKGAAPAVLANTAETETDALPPLTAASFYITPEPVKKKPGRRGKTSEKSAEPKYGTGAVNSPSHTDPEHAREAKPPKLDQADEADIPMHWLDEV